MSEIEIHDASDLRRYRTEIPNIVFMLGLSPFELSLYCHMKRTAGARSDGICKKSTQTLATEAGMSAGMVSEVKESLSKPRPILNGKPLINITESPNPHGGKPLHRVTLVDVWPENFQRFASSRPERASSQDEVASSPRELKKEPSRNEPSKSHSARGNKQPSDLRSSHPAIQAVRGLLNQYPNKLLYDEIILKLGEQFDADKLANCYKAWIGRGYKPTAITWLDWYATGIPQTYSPRMTQAEMNRGRRGVVI